MLLLLVPGVGMGAGDGTISVVVAGYICIEMADSPYADVEMGDSAYLDVTMRDSVYFDVEMTPDTCLED